MSIVHYLLLILEATNEGCGCAMHKAIGQYIIIMVNANVKTLGFNPLPIEIEVKDLKFIKELPKLLGAPHKVTFYQLVWITEGTARFQIDFREISIKAHEIMVILPNQICRFDVDAVYSGKMIIFTGEFYNLTEIDANFLYTAEILNPVSLNRTVPVNNQRANQLISILEDELRHRSDEFQIGIAQSILRVILLEMERMHTISYPPVVNSLARRFYNLVEAHFCEKHNAEFYISLLGVNEKTLSKELKTLTAITPKMYIDSRIVLETKRLLAYTALSVKEIGFKLGFDDPGNFNHYFRKHTGVTPAQFRTGQKNAYPEEIYNQ